MNSLPQDKFDRYHKPFDHVAIASLRKILRAKKCPPVDKKAGFRILQNKNYEFLAIGVREDGQNKWFPDAEAI